MRVFAWPRITQVPHRRLRLTSLRAQIGLLKSTSETKQVAIIVVSLLFWGVIWQLDLIGGFAFVAGCLATIIGLYCLSLNVGNSMHVFERGLALRKNGKTVVFAFDEVTSISAKHTADPGRIRIANG